MNNNLPQNLDFLLEKEWVEDFLNTNSKLLFGSSKNVEVIKIDRAYVMAPQSYNMLYVVKIDSQEISLRASSSTLASREKPFEIMQFIYESGFSTGNILSPQPIHYFSDINLMVYYNVSGSVLMNILSQSFIELAPKILSAAKALKKIHSIMPQPDFQLDSPNFDFKIDRISRFMPREKLDNVLAQYKNNLNGPDIFCHGDFQPNNLVIKDDAIIVIDFGASCFGKKELDLASFASQLEIMLLRSKNIEIFEKLKEVFLSNYGDFNAENFKTYSLYHDLLILDSMIAYLDNDPKPDKTEVKNSINYWVERMEVKYGRNS